MPETAGSEVSSYHRWMNDSLVKRPLWNANINMDRGDHYHATVSLRWAHCSYFKGSAEIQTPVGTATDSCFLRDIVAPINSSPLSLCLNPGPLTVPHSLSSDCNFPVISWWEGTLPGQPVPRSTRQGVRTSCSFTCQVFMSSVGHTRQCSSGPRGPWEMASLSLDFPSCPIPTRLSE